MTIRTYAATALLAGASIVAIGAASPAYALCDSYSGGCPSAPPTNGGGGVDIGGGADAPATGNENENPPVLDGGTGGTDTETGSTDTETGGTDAGAGASTVGENGGTGGPGRAGTATTPATPATLPFTGGELVLMTAAGLGALAGGTALVVAGRRKAVPVA